MKFFLSFTIAFIIFFSGKAISNNSDCPTTGSTTSAQYINSTITLKILLVEFSDVKHRTSPSAYTKKDFEDLLVSSGVYVSPNMYSPDGEAVYGSLNDYFQKMSNGNLTITGYIVNTTNGNDIPNWVALPNTKSYYATNHVIFSAALNAAASQGLNVGGLGDYVKLAIIYAGNIHFNFDGLNPKAGGNAWII